MSRVEALVPDAAGGTAASAIVPAPRVWQRPLPLAGAVVAVIAVVAVAGLAVWNVRAPERGAVMRFAYDLPAGHQFSNTGRAVVAFSPDGRHFAYNTVQGLYLRSMAALEPRLIPGTAPNLTTRLWGRGHVEARGELVPLVYQELRRRAAAYLRRERADHTLQPTALVHEAYVRLIGQARITWQNCAHFFGPAAQMMRRVRSRCSCGTRSSRTRSSWPPAGCAESTREYAGSASRDPA